MRRFRRRTEPPERRGPLVVVAPSHEQAQIYARTHGEFLGARVITTCSPIFPHGLMPLATDVLLLPGWELGRYAAPIEDFLRRALAKRGQRFEDCRLATTATARAYVRPASAPPRARSLPRP
jgi:hypothetical protein